MPAYRLFKNLWSGTIVRVDRLLGLLLVPIPAFGLLIWDVRNIRCILYEKGWVYMIVSVLILLLLVFFVVGMCWF